MHSPNNKLLLKTKKKKKKNKSNHLKKIKHAMENDAADFNHITQNYFCEDSSKKHKKTTHV